ncbi:unnamed protein product [Paramecium sonneborni]|uniref:H(+)-exporting diphosphatase n=1 Tax=Paramecium sonneborni TaxID=65129 RepID=A0A8S1R9H6_9CILI|nr:unnamed protein product [Paramecium sonneborni]
MGWLGSVIVIILTCILGIVWYFVHLIAQGFTSQYKDEQDFVSDQLRGLLGVEDIQPSSYRPTVEPQYLSGIVDLIETSIGGLWLAQFLYMILLLFLFFLAVDIWFIDYPFSFMFNAIIGAITVMLFAYYVTTTNSKSLTRALIQSQFSKEESFGYMYSCGFAIASLLFSLLFGMYVLMYYFNVAVWGGNMKKQEYEKVSILMIGYLMGVILGGFVYREGISIMCRSLKTASFGLIRADLNLSVGNNNISQLTRLAYMVSQQAGNTIVNFLDTGFVLLFLCCAISQIVINSPEILDSENRSAFILGPIYLICIGYLGFIICYFLKTICADQETGSFASLNVRWQVIIAAVISFIVHVSFPFSFLVDKFTLKGENTKDIDFSGKSSMHACWCYLLGLIFNVFHISIFEWFTSHGCPNVRNMGLATSDRILPMNLIFSNYLGDLYSAIPTVLMFLLITIVYSIEGFAGLLFTASGYVSLFIIYGVIFFIGSNSSDSYKLTCFAHFISDVQGKIFQIYWETKNYMIFLKATNAGTAFLVSIGIIGAQLYQYPTALNSLFLQNEGFLGLFIGFSLIFVCRGINTWGIINVAKNYFIFQPSDEAEGKLNYLKDIRIIEFTKFKYTHSILYVAYNILFVTIMTLVFGSILGHAGSVAILIGACIAVLLIQYNGLIKGTTLENSRVYNEIQDNRKDQHYLMYVSGDTYACATEESNACPLIPYLIYIFCLLISCQKHFAKAVK